MIAERCYWLFCFKPIESDKTISIFGFSEFISAIALLIIIYTITDVRYKFRIATAPGSLYITTFSLIGVIGFSTLLTDIWVNEGWWVPVTAGLTLSIWQGMFGTLFLTIVITWVYYAFIRPLIYSSRNAKKYAKELYRYILRGNEDELRVIANELAKSVKPLVQLSPDISSYPSDKKIPPSHALDILLLIGNRRFCRQIVSTSPGTAQGFFQEMTKSNKLNLPLNQFASNITSEAIIQKDSFIYNEQEGYESGLLGYIKPVSQALYGNYLLVEALSKSGSSPLDIHFEEQWSWTSTQWKAYCRVVLITLKDYLRRGYSSEHSYALYRAFGDIKHAYKDLYELNDTPRNYGDDIFTKFQVACDFVKDAIDLIENQEYLPKTLRLRRRDKSSHKDIYDHMANLIFDMCETASHVNSPIDTCWAVQHNILWNSFFSRFDNDGKAIKIVTFKVRRLLYNEITLLSKYPNYKGSRLLGLCLNNIGMTVNKNTHDKDYYTLAKAIHKWTKKNYIILRKDNPDVAKSVLIGSLSFNKKRQCLVKTYLKGLNKKAPKSYLYLE